MHQASQSRFSRLAACSAAGLALAFAVLGCGPAKNNSEVTGKVAYKGEPVTGGTIILHSAEETPGIKGESTFRITIKPDGTFSATNLPTGPMKVTIETDSVKGSEGPVIDPKTGMPPGMKTPPNYDPSQFKQAPAADTGSKSKYVAIPKRYADPKTSGLTWDVKGGPEKKDFDLTD